MLISAAAQGAWVVEDCTLATENRMLAAYNLGLGSCWIGLAQSYFKTPEGKAALGLPAACEPVAPIILGRPKATAPCVARKESDVRGVG
jgi:nitroreductase